MSILKSFKEFMEDAPVNAVGTDGGIDLNPTGKPRKMDRRSRWDVNKMFRRAEGVKKSDKESDV